jgi:AcrR family transcriptional regulator
MSDNVATRAKILEAARQRFLHYGYSKTTMSEVARDCEMSAGNIYRFFGSKLDIAEAMATKFNSESYANFKAIANKKSPAPDRLYEFFSHALEQTYEAIDADAKILEIAEILRKERPDFFNAQMAAERVFLETILNDGAEAGLFRKLDEPLVVAEMIQAALMKFRFPQAYSQLKLDKLRYELMGVITLILAGLSSTAVEFEL